MRQADELTGAARYERSDCRKAYRAGHPERDLTAKAGTMSVRVAQAQARTLRVRQRYRRREESVEEALMRQTLLRF